MIDVETNFDAARNSGIKGGKTAVITDNQITGKKTIDALAHSLTTGFIDTEFHQER